MKSGTTEPMFTDVYKGPSQDDLGKIYQATSIPGPPNGRRTLEINNGDVAVAVYFL